MHNGGPRFGALASYPPKRCLSAPFHPGPRSFLISEPSEKSTLRISPEWGMADWSPPDSVAFAPVMYMVSRLGPGVSQVRIATHRQSKGWSGLGTWASG